MSETKFTPGQWMKKYDGPSLPIITADNPTDPPFTVVALVRTGEADANLIAAAPDLYEALESALLSFEEMSEPGRLNAPVVRAWLENSATVRQIKTALRKARGEDNG